MDKAVKIILGIIFVIILFGIVCFGTFKLTNKNDDNNMDNQVINQIDTNTVNNTLNENIVDEENVTNTVKNTVKETKPETKPQETVTTPPPAVQNSIYETNSDAATTDKQQQAIELVKKDWGEDSTVTFNCDHVTPQGEFVIAVISTETASVKSYFIVNLEKQTVMVDY